jgi:hypothetical protein
MMMIMVMLPMPVRMGMPVVVGMCMPVSVIVYVSHFAPIHQLQKYGRLVGGLRFDCLGRGRRRGCDL